MIDKIKALADDVHDLEEAMKANQFDACRVILTKIKWAAIAMGHEMSQHK